jgi:hypothetical protein
MDSGKHDNETSGFIIRHERSHQAEQLLCQGGVTDGLLHGVSHVKRYIQWIHIDQNKIDLITFAC